MTARVFARHVATERPGAGAMAFATLTESYLTERFGGRGPGAGPAELKALRRALRRPGERRSR